MRREVKLAIGIPALNEESTIGKVIARSLDSSRLILVVDDASRDDTALVAKALGATVLKHHRTMGKGAALRECLKWARRVGADVLVTLDADGQHDAYEIPKLVDALRAEHADVVVGSRFSRPSGMPRFRWAGGRVLDRATGIRISDRTPDTQSGFRAYSRRAIRELVASEYGMGVDAQVLMRANEAGMKIFEVPVAISYDGRRGPRRRNTAIHALDVIFSVVKFTSIRHPFVFFGGFSALCFIVSLTFGLWAFEYYQRYKELVTNLALISISAGIVGILSLFTGVILFTIITVIRQNR